MPCSDELWWETGGEYDTRYSTQNAFYQRCSKYWQYTSDDNPYKAYRTLVAELLALSSTQNAQSCCGSCIESKNAMMENDVHRGIPRIVLLASPDWNSMIKHTCYFFNKFLLFLCWLKKSQSVYAVSCHVMPQTKQHASIDINTSYILPFHLKVCNARRIIS